MKTSHWPCQVDTPAQSTSDDKDFVSADHGLRNSVRRRSHQCLSTPENRVEQKSHHQNAIFHYSRSIGRQAIILANRQYPVAGADYFWSHHAHLDTSLIKCCPSKGYTRGGSSTHVQRPYWSEPKPQDAALENLGVRASHHDVVHQFRAIKYSAAQ